MQSVLLLSMTSLRNTCKTGWICRTRPSRQFPLVSLGCGYNAIIIPLSPKARLCLKEGKAEREPLQRANEALSPMCFLLLWSFCSLSLFQEDTEQPALTRMVEQAKMRVLLQDPNSHLPICLVLPCAVSPALHPAQPNPALEQFMPSSRNPVLSH